MLENNEMDALLMTEPQVTEALLMKHHTLLDTRKLDMRMGAIVEDSVVMSLPGRQRQREALVKGYNAACDSLNHLGLKPYYDVIRRHYDVSEQALRRLPDSLKFMQVTAPREKDIELARQWAGRLKN